jgi:hypothetical protein
MINLNYAEVKTPKPELPWQNFSDVERIKLVENSLSSGLVDFSATISIVEAKENGQIIITLTKPMKAQERGVLLLDLEEYLKEVIEPSLVVWLQPLGDRNSLRNLRGIEVKK